MHPAYGQLPHILHRSAEIKLYILKALFPIILLFLHFLQADHTLLKAA